MLVEHGGTVLLVDAGLPSQRGLAQALSEGGYTWEDIDAVLVSHLHGDHIHPSAVACCARHEVPILLHEENVRPFTRRILSRSALSGPVCTFDAEEFVDSDLILIESNYDPGMLAASPRQDRTRVDSEVGHLSNEQAGKFLARVMLESRTLPQTVVLCHLSADHNTPAKAVGTVP